jgi:hypothetical protein
MYVYTRVIDAQISVLDLQWTQNNSELKLHHRKSGRKDEKGKGEQDDKESA